MNRFRIASDNPVRRRLFSNPDTDAQADIDNYTNVLQEQISTDNIEKSKKWNFDFDNDIPLEGVIEWTPLENNWIGKAKLGTNDIKENDPKSDEDDDLQEINLKRKMNLKTPKTSKEGENAPLLRKRKREILQSRLDKGVRRSLSFDR